MTQHPSGPNNSPDQPSAASPPETRAPERSASSAAFQTQRTRDLEQRTAVTGREGAVAAREETATLREEAAGLREEAAGLREETSALGEEAVRAREEAAGLRERTTTLGAEAVRAREDAADLREETSTLGVEATLARERAASLREESSTLGERAVRAREEAVTAREEVHRLMAAVHETNERLVVSTIRAQAIAADAEQATLQEELFATLSHELRTPLNAVLGWARMLGASQLSPERAWHAVAVIERNAAALTHSLDDLLDVSRIGTRTLLLALHPCDLVVMIQETLDTLRPFAAAKNVGLVFSPDQRAVGTIRGDAKRLQQVLWNLLANAVKFTPENGRVDVFVEPDVDYVTIRVVDNGEGISPDFLPYVFEPFRQADGTTTRHHGGLGLGLAIVRQLVELHGGTVEAASQGEGQGATFTVRLAMSSEAQVARIAS